MKGFISLLVGFLFAIGLGLSGMTQPQVVKSFLDIFGHWDYRLILVMMGAISVHGILFRFIIKRKSPILDDKFHLPENHQITKRLLIGAALFGLGWGWAGICPGPGIVGLVSGRAEFLIFIISMIAGMKLFLVIEKRERK